jgi:hypothetical protein
MVAPLREAVDVLVGVAAGETGVTAKRCPLVICELSENLALVTPASPCRSANSCYDRLGSRRAAPGLNAGSRRLRSGLSA